MPLDEVNPDHVSHLLNQVGAQHSLLRNIWLIHSKNESSKIKDYFARNKLRIGLNAQIFFIKTFAGFSQEITQIIGKGTTEISSKVRIYQSICEIAIK